MGTNEYIPYISQWQGAGSFLFSEQVEFLGPDLSSTTKHTLLWNIPVSTQTKMPSADKANKKKPVKINNIKHIQNTDLKSERSGSMQKVFSNIIYIKQSWITDNISKAWT